jgi:hypothetical protein
VLAIAENAHVAGQVFAVSLDLEDWMELRAAAHVLDKHQFWIFLEKLGMAPLLQFDDYVCVATGAAVLPRQYHIGALAGEGELVFDEHLYLAQSRLHEIVGKDRKTAIP